LYYIWHWGSGIRGSVITRLILNQKWTKTDYQRMKQHQNSTMTRLLLSYKYILTSYPGEVYTFENCIEEIASSPQTPRLELIFSTVKKLA